MLTETDKHSSDMDEELFGEMHEQEENGLYGKRHERELLGLSIVVEPKGKFYCWAVIEYGSDECRCKKQCKACAINDKQ